MGCKFSSLFKTSIKRKEKKSKIHKFTDIDNNSALKILLLGAGESGKTTIAKQMKIIHGSGYNDGERDRYIPLIQKNVLDLMNNILIGMKKFEIPCLNPTNKDISEKLMKSIRLDDTFEECVDMIKKIKSDPGFIEAISRGYEFQINDTHLEFLDCLDKLASLEYKPSDADILKTRLKTSGIFEFAFPYKNFTIRLIDIGGQRSERKKWVHCFEDLNAMIYVASLVDYCMVLEEDNMTNRLTESVKLFSAMCNNPYFSSIPIILFLNKKDLFDKKILVCPLEQYFPNYIKGNDLDSELLYIQGLYMTANRVEPRQVYVHVTNATNTSNIKFVFDAVSDIILKKSLKETGLIF